MFSSSACLSLFRAPPRKARAIALAVGAGYDKDKVGKFYERLLLMEKNAQKGGGTIVKSLADALSTHPPSEERVKQMNELAANAPAVKNPLVSSADYGMMKQVAAGLRTKK